MKLKYKYIMFQDFIDALLKLGRCEELSSRDRLKLFHMQKKIFAGTEDFNQLKAEYTASYKDDLAKLGDKLIELLDCEIDVPEPIEYMGFEKTKLTANEMFLLRFLFSEIPEE